MFSITRSTRRARLATAAVLASAAVLAAASSAAATGQHATARGTRWVASLSGNQQVPPVSTSATGSALFRLVDNGQALAYQIRVHDVTGVVEEHIHLGAPGTNGPAPVVSFLDVPAPGVSGEVDLQGYVTAADLTGSLAGHPLRDLVQQLDAGNAYINVHTAANPMGEIRGNLSRL